MNMHASRFLQRWLCSAGIGWLMISNLSSQAPNLCHAQEFALTTSPQLAPPQLALATERLMMEQTRDLSSAGQQSEALKLLEKLLDEAENRIVPAQSTERAATLQTQRFIPLTLWTGLEARALLMRFPDAVANLLLQQREQASVALLQLRAQKDLPASVRAARRYLATDELGLQFHLLLSDLYLEQGLGVAASQALCQLAAEIPTPVPTLAASDGSTPPAVKAEGQTTQPERESASSTNIDSSQSMELISRLMIAAAMDPQALDRNRAASWAEQLTARLPEDQRTSWQQRWQTIAQWPEQTASEPQQPIGSFQSDAWRLWHAPSDSPPPLHPSFAPWPTWSQSLERYAVGNDLIGASLPRVAESERGSLPYFPVVVDGTVFVNEMTRIVAYDLRSGQAWPNASSPLPLFDSQLSPSAYLPLGYPMIGVPRGTLEIENNCLYARLGSPITGHIQSRTANRGQSISYLVGLDLGKQASMLPGFPLHLRGPDFTDAEFDGPPIAWGELLIVAVAERDHVGLRRSLAAFHRWTGQLIWKTGALAAGPVVAGERANLISHQQLTLAGGRLFYNTHLGAIVCLDPLTGQTQWLVQYSTPRDDPAYPKPNRYRYRDLTPCLVSAGMVYCAPQDAPEIFALDAMTGRLVWSTDDASVADCNQLLGVAGTELIVSGDRLVWLNARSGSVRASFPAATTSMVGGALPNPRGLGRGVVWRGQVYWPTAGEIFLFPASLPANVKSGSQLGEVPQIVARWPLTPGGNAGGNLSIANGTLLVATPSRLMAYATLTQTPP